MSHSVAGHVASEVVAAWSASVSFSVLAAGVILGDRSLLRRNAVLLLAVRLR
jgi:hypothetical protein